MKHIIQVFKFEYLNCIKNKAFIITTIILMLLILGMAFIPAIIMGIANSDNEPADGEIPVIAVLNNAYDDSSTVQAIFQQCYPDSQVNISAETLDDIKTKVDNEDYQFAVVLDAPLDFVYVTKNNSLMSDETQIIGQVIQSLYHVVKLNELGVTPAQSAEILNAPVTSHTITTGVDQTKNYWSTYILIMILYMAIIMYGQMVSQSVVTEKNTRAMEMLITCAKPSHLMFGKVLGSGVAGLTQLVVITGMAVISVKTISLKSLPNELAEMINFPISTLLYALLFFLTAYFIYSFLLGALSSLASRSEDLNTLTTPVMLLFVAAFMIVIVAVNSGDLNTPLMIVCSYIPFTAPIAMFARIALSDVAFYEIIISVIVQLVSIYLLGMLAAAIYRIGVLMYGNPPKPAEIIKLLKEQHKTNKSIKSA